MKPTPAQVRERHPVESELGKREIAHPVSEAGARQSRSPLEVEPAGGYAEVDVVAYFEAQVRDRFADA